MQAHEHVEIESLQPGTLEAAIFPATGQVYEADYGGDYLVQFTFHSVSSMTIQGMKGRFKDFIEKVNISVTSIRPGVFLVAWQEANGTSVVHVEDFERGVVYANVTLPDRARLRMRGSFRPAPPRGES